MEPSCVLKSWLGKIEPLGVLKSWLDNIVSWNPDTLLVDHWGGAAWNSVKLAWTTISERERPLMSVNDNPPKITFFLRMEKCCNVGLQGLGKGMVHMIYSGSNLGLVASLGWWYGQNGQWCFATCCGKVSKASWTGKCQIDCRTGLWLSAGWRAIWLVFCSVHAWG